MLIPEVSVMSPKSRCIPYKKNIVINALYDVIDALGLSLDSANSMRGTLIVSDTEHKGKMRIALACGLNANQTQVDFYPENGSVSFTEKWSPVILDEIEGRIRRVVSNVKR
jgi:hypothetical protein